MLTSSERAKLRAMANTEQAILHVGAGGITDNVVNQLDGALEARELVKCTVQKGCDLSAREACTELCERTGADPVQVIGRKFTLYRPSKKKIITL